MHNSGISLHHQLVHLKLKESVNTGAEITIGGKGTARQAQKMHSRSLNCFVLEQNKSCERQHKEHKNQEKTIHKTLF